jgi:hypothetical protein
MPPPEEKNANGKLKLLESIASGGDNWIKFGTLLLVVITGGGNFLATTKTGEFNAEEIRRGLQEIHDLHDQLSTMVDRQRRMADQVDDINRRQMWPNYQMNPSLPTPTPGH